VNDIRGAGGRGLVGPATGERFRRAVLGCLVIGGCALEPDVAIEPDWITLVPLGPDIVAGDTVQWFGPRSLQVAGSEFVVADPTNGRIVVLDSTLAFVEGHGRPGDGPGELRRPLFATGNGSVFAVHDAANLRLSVFDRSSGEVIESFGLEPRTMDGSFAVSPDGRIITSGGPDGPDLVAWNDGTEDLLVDGDGYPGPMRFDRILSGPHGPLVAREDGRIDNYDWEGRPTLALHLPSAIVLARDSIIATAQAGGMDVIGVPLFGSGSIDVRGRLVGLFGGPLSDGAIGFVADLTSGAFQRLRLADPTDSSVRESLATRTGAVLLGDTLVVLNRYGFARFALTDDVP
jgi:hypothetical protein